MKPLIKGGWREGRMVVSWVARWRSWNMQWFARAPRLLVTSGLLPLKWPVKKLKISISNFLSISSQVWHNCHPDKVLLRFTIPRNANSTGFIVHSAPIFGKLFHIFTQHWHLLIPSPLEGFRGCPKKALFKKHKFDCFGRSWTVLDRYKARGYQGPSRVPLYQVCCPTLLLFADSLGLTVT